MARTRGSAGFAAGLIAVSVAVLLAVALLASACAEAQALVGTWTSEEQSETLLFRTDGTATLVTAGGVMIALTWEASGSRLTLGVKDQGTRTVEYSIDGNVLTMTAPGEEPAHYARMQER